MNLQEAEAKARKMKLAELTREDVQVWLSAQPENGYDPAEAHQLIDRVYQEQAGETPPTTPFNLTDSGNAEYFVSLFGDQVRYDHLRGRWLQWGTHCWRPETDGHIVRLALKAARTRYKAAVSVADLELREKIAKWAISSEQRAKLEASIAIAESLKPIADSGERWDRDGWLFCVQNGVVDLRSGQLRPGRPEDMVTQQSPVTFEPGAKAPRWEQFLDQVTGGNGELKSYLQRGVGYSLTAETKGQVWFFLYGLGSNGKTTFTMTIRRLMGDYGVRIDSDDLMIKEKKASGSSPKEGVADTRGKRFAVASEVQDGKRLDIGLLKDMSGQDSIKARRLYEHEQEFLPTHKLWMFGNHKPIITDTTHAAWRRLKLIPFAFKVPENEIDPDLQAKLDAELPGILNWAIAGCLEWQRENFNEPGVVTDAVAAYRHDSDLLADFIEDCCILEHMATASKSEMKDAYEQWCKENGQEPISRNTFKTRLIEKGVGEGRAGKRGRFWTGIRLRTKADNGDISDKTPGDFVAKVTKQTEFPIKSPHEERNSNTLQESDKSFVTDTLGDLPDCPVCGRNEWTFSPDGDLTCPCGYRQKGALRG